MSKEEHHPAFGFFFKQVEENPTRIALVDELGGSHSFKELYERTSYCREKLSNQGVKNGSRVMVMPCSAKELYPILLALMSLRACPVLMDSSVPARCLRRILSSLKPDVLVCDSKTKRRAMFQPYTWRIPKWWSFKKLLTSKGAWEFPQGQEEEIVLIYCKRTGKNSFRALELNRANVRARQDILRDHFSDEIQNMGLNIAEYPLLGLAALGLGKQVFAGFGTIGINSCLLLGKKDFKGFLEDRAGNAPKGVVFHLGLADSFEMIQMALEYFRQTQFLAVYCGLETGPMAFSPFEQVLEKMAEPLNGIFAGKILDEATMRVIKPIQAPVYGKEFLNLQLMDGELGEIVVSGPQVQKTYFRDELAFAESKIVDEKGGIWHRTGDIGYLKGEDLYLVGSMERIMDYKGKLIHPFPLEAGLKRYMKLRDMAYVQDAKGRFVLHLGRGEEVNRDKIREVVDSLAYPLDEIWNHQKKLPRDPWSGNRVDVKKLKI